MPIITNGLIWRTNNFGEEPDKREEALIKPLLFLLPTHAQTEARK